MVQIKEQDLIHYEQVALEAAQKAGNIIKEAFYKPKDIEYKGAVDLVTQSDKLAEQTIFGLLKKHFKDHKFIGEETSTKDEVLDDQPTWMVDPIDGTTNFVQGFPFVCTCIGLSINKEVQVGIVFNPILNELYKARRGNGAYLNDQKISVSQTQEMLKAFIASEVGVSRDSKMMRSKFLKLEALSMQIRGLRLNGSCALNTCMIAKGVIDGFYEIGFGGCWDIAAASIILEEAGGVLMDPNGSEFDVMSKRVLAANNDNLALQLASVLKAIPDGPYDPKPTYQ